MTLDIITNHEMEIMIEIHEAWHIPLGHIIEVRGKGYYARLNEESALARGLPVGAYIPVTSNEKAYIDSKVIEPTGTRGIFR